MDLLIDGFISWVDQKPLPAFYTTIPAFLILIRCQSLIGWDQIIKGRLSTEWATIQQSHLSSLSEARTWQRKLIRTIYNLWYDLWSKRNASRHGHDQRERNLRTREYHLRQAEILYNVSELLPDSFNYIFRRPWEDFQTLPTNGIRTWLNLHSDHIRTTLRESTSINLPRLPIPDTIHTPLPT